MSSIITTSKNTPEDWREQLRAAAGEVVRQEAEAHRRADVSQVVFDRDYKARKKQLLRRAKDEPAVWYSVRTVLSRVAVFLFVILAAGSVTFLSVSAVRKQIWNAVMEWHEGDADVSESLGVQTEITSALSSSATSSEQLQELSPAFTSRQNPETSKGDQGAVMQKIEQYFFPTAVPEDIEQWVLEQSETKYDVEFYLGGKYYFRYQMAVWDGRIWPDLEDTIITEVKLHEKTVYLIQYDSEVQDTIQIVWTDGEYEFYMQTFAHCMSAEALIAMADSVQ